jgi:hypothetical protein
MYSAIQPQTFVCGRYIGSANTIICSTRLFDDRARISFFIKRGIPGCGRGIVTITTAMPKYRSRRVEHIIVLADPMYLPQTKVWGWIAEYICHHPPLPVILEGPTV